MNVVRSCPLVPLALLLALVWVLDGCSKQHIDPFALCPDGKVDAPTEQCDDGNLEERDNCPSDCQNPFCGDGIAWVLQDGQEQCDGPDLVGQSCNSLGFAEKTPGVSGLTCTSHCHFDLLSCGPRFTPTATPTDTPPPTETPTPTETPVGGSATPTMTPTATPTAKPCTPSGSSFVVQIAYTAPAGQPVSAVKVLVGFVDTSVSLPPPIPPRIGNRPPNSLVVPNLTDAGLSVLVSRSGDLPQGNLFTISFDQCEDAAPPPIDTFACTVSECTSSFGPVDGCECTVSNVP